ncbi:hypothetical protein [Spiroplasma tabanidicola]|uniref:ABC transporter permease n=1 Tax=Spiroplasma tabanidicola TaxID=324079 RepID=A0A6I6C6Z6_9MOLU|nr:hypothetical protein [Spiroplasma tabanidicola]QGS51556.1 ABC transporter permease [Spiroplasma tabanidicola]
MEAKLVKNKSEKKPFKIMPRFEGKMLLFFITIRKSFSSKASKGTGITFLILSFIFTLITALTNKGFRVDQSISQISITIGYIFIIFFYLVFASIIVVSLFKVPILEGIQQIETRAGISLFKSFLIKYIAYITVTYIYLLINLIIAAILSTTFSNQPLSSALLIFSPVLFLMLFTLIWFPILCTISLISSVAMGTFGNIFLGAIVSLTPFINGMIGVNEDYDKVKYRAIIRSQIAKLSFANDFYKKFITDDKVKGIFEEDSDTDILKTIANNLEVVNLEDLALDNLETGLIKEAINSNSSESSRPNGNSDSNSQISFSYSTVVSKLIRALYAGQFNLELDSSIREYKNHLDDIEEKIINSNPNNSGSFNEYSKDNLNTKIALKENNLESIRFKASTVSQKTVLSGLEINNVLNEIYNKVAESIFTEDQAPVSYPGYQGGLFIDPVDEQLKSINQSFLDIDSLSKWLEKKLPDYSNLLKYINSQYNNYNEILFNRSKWTSSQTGDSFNDNEAQSIFRVPANTGTDLYSINGQTDSNLLVYKRYPELMMINNLIIQNWINTMTYSTEFLRILGNLNFEDSLGIDEAQNSLQNYMKDFVKMNQLNLFNHFWIMYEGLIYDSAYGDALFTNTYELASKGVNNSIENFVDYAKYATAKTDRQIKYKFSSDSYFKNQITDYMPKDSEGKVTDWSITLENIDGELSREKIFNGLQMLNKKALIASKNNVNNIQSVSIAGLTAVKSGSDWYIRPVKNQSYWKNPEETSGSQYNFKDVKVIVKNLNTTTKLQSIFKENPLQKGLGFNIILAALSYFAFSLLATILVFLLFRRQSRI